ncbi:MAG: heavy-metal-associated domain-containing protein [Chloroflexi bacterium]|nr:heavy-metal-associated domain-containing protein [Chloroflexota bacterium]
MKTIMFTLPMMYGDHHVLAVRQLLTALPGVADVYASSNFHIVETRYDETELNEETIRATLAEAGYLEALPMPVEVGSAPAQENDRPFFRHTTAFTQTGQAIGFAQNVPDVQRPLWPCPGFEQ